MFTCLKQVTLKHEHVDLYISKFRCLASCGMFKTKLQSIIASCPQELWPWHEFMTCRPSFCTKHRFFKARQSITTWRYLSQPLRACTCNDPLDSKTFHRGTFTIAAYKHANHIRIYRLQLVFTRENHPIHIQEKLLKPEMPMHA